MRVYSSISDPGHDLIKAAIEEDIVVVIVPGVRRQGILPGLPRFSPQPVIFLGFTLKIGTTKAFSNQKDYPGGPQIFCESPHHVAVRIGKYARGLRCRPVVLVRELTKSFMKEYQRGEKITELVGGISETPLKGRLLDCRRC